MVLKKTGKRVGGPERLELVRDDEPDLESGQVERSQEADQESEPTAGETPEQEEERIDEEVQEQAMKESRSFFVEREARVTHALGEAEVKSKIQELFKRATAEETITEEMAASELPMMSEEEGFITALVEFLNKNKPILDFNTSYEAFIGYVESDFNVAKQMDIARNAYDSGSSWYHTTAEGKKRHAEIRQEVETQNSVPPVAAAA